MTVVHRFSRTNYTSHVSPFSHFHCHNHDHLSLPPHKKGNLFFWAAVCVSKRGGCLIKIKMLTEVHILLGLLAIGCKCVFVLIRAEGIDPGTGSDRSLGCVGSPMRGQWIPTASPVINRTLHCKKTSSSLYVTLCPSVAHSFLCPDILTRN